MRIRFGLRRVVVVAMALAVVYTPAQVAAQDREGAFLPGSRPKVAQQSEDPQWGGRLAFVDADGDLWARSRHSDGPSIRIARDVQDFQMLDWSLAVLKRDGTLWLGEGALTEPLKQIDVGVAAFQLTLTRVGILRKDGTFRLAEPGFDPEDIATGVRSFQVSNHHVAVLGFDGTLWMHRGGVVDRLDRIAEGVASFQIDREWLAYVTQGGGRLMLSKTDFGKPFKFVEFARGVADFEMEIFVEMSETFPSRMHLAAVTAGRALLYGEGGSAALTAQRVTGVTGASRVHWADGQLGVGDSRGGLYLAHVAEQEAGQRTLGAFEYLGVAGAWRLTAEHDLLLHRGAGRWNVVDSRLAPPATGRAGPLASAAALAAAPRADSASERPAALSAKSAAAPVVVDVSSLRPWFTRRPMAMSTSSAGTKLAASALTPLVATSGASTSVCRSWSCFPSRGKDWNYAAKYIDNYSKARKSCIGFNGVNHCRPNIKDSRGRVWMPYLDIRIDGKSVCWDVGYLRKSSKNDRPGCSGFTYRDVQFLAMGATMRKGKTKFYVFPGEIRPNYYGIVPLDPNIYRNFRFEGHRYYSPWIRTLPTSKLSRVDRTGSGGGNSEWYFTNFAAAIREAGLFDGAGTIEKIAPRATGVRYSGGRADVYIRGFGHGSSLWADASELVQNHGYMGGAFSSPGPTVRAIRDWLFFNRIPAEKTRLFGHSMAGLDVTILGNLGWAETVNAYGVPSTMDNSYMVDRPYVDFTYYGRTNDWLTNGIFQNTIASRQNYGVDFHRMSSFGSFPNLVEPHSLVNSYGQNWADWRMFD